MRKAKDNENVPKHYYRPSEKTCPTCGRPLHRRYTLWHKYLVTLEGRVYVFSFGYSCRRRRCSQSHLSFHGSRSVKIPKATVLASM